MAVQKLFSSKKSADKHSKEPEKSEKSEKAEPNPSESGASVLAEAAQAAQTDTSDEKNLFSAEVAADISMQAVQTAGGENKQPDLPDEIPRQDEAIAPTGQETDFKPIELDIPAPKFANEVGGYSRSMVNAYISQLSDLLIDTLDRSERERKAACLRAEKSERVLRQFAVSAAELIEYYDEKIKKNLVQLRELAEYEKKGTSLLEKECARKTISAERLRSMTIYEKRLTTLLDRECAILERQKNILTEWVRDLRRVLDEPVVDGISDWLALLSAEEAGIKPKTKPDPSDG
jgi:hypothetical protein